MNATYQQSGAALLRITLGVMFVAHGLLKVLVFTLPGTAAHFESIGLPGVLAYVVTLAEVGGGLMLIAGVYTRAVALATVPILIGATWAHIGNGWVFSAEGGGWEYPLFLVIAALSVALLGPGRWALQRAH